MLPQRDRGMRINIQRYRVQVTCDLRCHCLLPVLTSWTMAIVASSVQECILQKDGVHMILTVTTVTGFVLYENVVS